MNVFPTHVERLSSLSEYVRPFMNCDVWARYNVDTPDALGWAQDFADRSGMLGALSEYVRSFFDYAAWARNAIEHGDILVVELGGGEVAVCEAGQRGST